jgi:hypothetical protein
MYKKLFVVLLVALGSYLPTRACPICGCGGGNLYMGLMPDFQYHFVGLRYHYTHYYSQLVNDPSQYSNNYYNTFEFWGGLRLGKKFQLMAFVPYYENKQVDDDGTTYTHGLGDITVMGQYQVFQSKSFLGNHKMVNQQLWLGGGIKLPTGPFNIDMQDSSTTVADINAQIGTGSVDFLLNGMYNLNIRNFGVSASVTYKINTINDEHYKYGNKFTSNLIAYYHFSKKQVILTPNAGIGFESVAINNLEGKKVQYTGSQVMTAIAGIEVNINRVNIGINTQLPLAQNFAEGQTRLKMGAMMHITYEL